MWEHTRDSERGKDACEVAQFTLDPADRIGQIRAMIELSLIDDRKVYGETDIDAARAQKVQLRRLVGRAGVDVRAIADLEVSSRPAGSAFSMVSREGRTFFRFAVLHCCVGIADEVLHRQRLGEGGGACLLRERWAAPPVMIRTAKA